MYMYTRCMSFISFPWARCSLVPCERSETRSLDFGHRNLADQRRLRKR